MGRFMYILDSSDSEPVSEPVTDKQSSHLSTAKEIRVKATFFFM